MTAKLALGGRKNVQRVRMLDGEEVKATFYFGSHDGHGNYMAGYVSQGDLICDANGKPIPLRQVGHLE